MPDHADLLGRETEVDELPTPALRVDDHAFEAIEERPPHRGLGQRAAWDDVVRGEDSGAARPEEPAIQLRRAEPLHVHDIRLREPETRHAEGMFETLHSQTQPLSSQARREGIIAIRCYTSEPSPGTLPSTIPRTSCYFPGQRHASSSQTPVTLHRSGVVMGDEMSEVRDRESSRSGEHRGSFAVYADPANLLHLSGELDAASASTLASAPDPLTARGVVWLDLAELTFMDSTGINALCQTKQRLGEQGRIVLINPPPPVLRVIEIAGLSGIFE